jgi:hypothetical protein
MNLRQKEESRMFSAAEAIKVRILSRVEEEKDYKRNYIMVFRVIKRKSGFRDFQEDEDDTPLQEEEKTIPFLR